MAWSKIKNIIITILLLLNLFLLFLVAGQSIRSARYETDTLRQTIEALALNGISLDDSILPGEMTLPSLTITRNRTAEENAAQLLLNSDVVMNNTGNTELYTSAAGTVSFRGSGEFSATLQQDWTAHPTPELHAQALLNQLNVQAWTLNTNNNTVTITQSISGIPAFQTRLTLSYNSQYLLSMEGKLILGTITPDTEQSKTISIPTALVSLLDYIMDSGTACRSIHAITPGYLTAGILTDAIRLTPCWLIETDVASYYVDAVTGTVTKVG